MILYKYLAPARLDVLRDGRIHCTQPLLFNDRFESKPYIAAMPPKDVMERISKVEAERASIPEEMRLAILEESEKPERIEAVMHMIMAVMGSTVGVLHY